MRIATPRSRGKSERVVVSSPRDSDSTYLRCREICWHRWLASRPASGLKTMRKVPMEPANDSLEPLPKAHSMLVVADVDLDAKLFDHLLRQEWLVEYVSSNDEALSVLQKRPYDLIVTAEATSAREDLKLLQKIRAVRPHVRMIILTKQSTAEEVLLALRQRAFSYFSAPYTFESLREMIHTAMEKPTW